MPFPNSDGFSAAAFRNPMTGEVVIAYAGTDADTFGLLATDFLYGNIPAAVGLYAPQVWEAIKFYSDVRKHLNLPENQNANITLTGHSLGGGLASVVGVYFNEPARVFDLAPFELSVHNQTLISPFALLNARLGTILKSKIPTGIYFDLYAQYQGSQNPPRVVNPAFQQYVEAFSEIGSYNGLFGQREQQISEVHLDGEVLEWARLAWPEIATSQLDWPIVANELTVFQLHSLSLLTALQISSLGPALEALPEALVPLFDNDFYHNPDLATEPSRDFLMQLIRNEIGVKNTENKTGNGLLAHFVTDLQTLSVARGSSFITPDMLSALIAGTMDYYYLNDFLATGNTPSPFVEIVSGGFHLDYTRVPVTSGRKGHEKLVAAFTVAYPANVQGSIRELLDGAQHWYVQSGSAPLDVTGTGDKDAFIAFTGAANLDGGAGNDLMDRANRKTGPLMSVSGLEPRINSADVLESEVGSPVATSVDYANPIRCDLQLNRLIHAMASFKKQDSFDSISKVPVGDELSMAIQRVTASPMRDAPSHGQTEYLA